MPDDFPGITLPYPDEKPGVMTKEEKEKAIRNLVLKLAVMDGIVLVVLYGIQTLVPWWNEMTLLFIFMMMGGITIIYFNGKLKKITND
jgi:DMSO reductase anchor subunit